MTPLSAASGRAITALYVPGDRPDRFEKARSSGADYVIIDLEDAVAPPAKEGARRAAVEWISGLEPIEHLGVGVQVRVNSGDEADLRAIANLSSAVGIRVPKVENLEQLDLLAAHVGNHDVTVLLETSGAIENAASLAAHPVVAALAIGESDLSSELAVEDPTVLEYIRIRVLIAARAAGLPAPMLSAYPDIRDLDGLRADTVRGRRLGYFGRVAVHPSQLAVIKEVFTPSVDEREWARAVVAAVGRGGVATLSNGTMVDPAMLGRARRILER